MKPMNTDNLSAMNEEMNRLRQEALAEVQDFLMARDYANAEAQLRALAAFDPNDATVLFLLAQSLRFQAHFAEAALLFNRLVTENPSHGLALHELGLICSAQQQFSEAEIYLRQALLLDQNSNELRFDLALVLIAQLREQEAKIIVEEIAFSDPQFPGLVNLTTQLTQKINLSEPSALPTQNCVAYTPFHLNERIRVVLILPYAISWAHLQSVWEVLSADARFTARLVFSPYKEQASNPTTVHRHLKGILQEKNIPFVHAAHFDFAAFAPHVAIFPTPYEDNFPTFLSVEALWQLGIRIAYIPYGLDVGGGAFNYMCQFNRPIHQCAWRIFTRSARHQAMFGRYCQTGNAQVAITGHPKFDAALAAQKIQPPPELVAKIAGRKVILWAPHFTVTGEWSSLPQYGAFIIATMKKRPDLFLLVRPHPALLLRMRIVNQDDDQAFYAFAAEIKEMENGHFDQTSNQNLAFTLSNAFMVDAGSFLLEYLPQQKAMLYLRVKGGLGLHEEANALLEFIDVADDLPDVQRFIDEIADGKDAYQATREAAMHDFLFGIDGKSSLRIAEEIYQALMAQDNVSALLTTHHAPLLSTKGAENEWALIAQEAPEALQEAKKTAINEILQRQFSPKTRVAKALDLGCGDGFFTCLLTPYAERVYGVDHTHASLRLAFARSKQQGTHQQTTFTHADMHAFLPPEKFGILMCLENLSYITNDALLLQFLDRLAVFSSFGSTLLMADFFSKKGDVIAKEECVGEKGESLVYPRKYRLADDLIQLLTRRGFALKTRHAFAAQERLHAHYALFELRYERQ